MHRREIGRGRWIVAVGALVLLLSAVVNWWSQQSAPGLLPAEATRPGLSDDLKILILFLSSIGALMLIALPYAADGPVGIDRPFSFLVLLAIALGCYVWRVIELTTKDRFPFPPQQGLGLWIAGAGLIIFSRGVFEIFDRSHPR